LSKYNHSLHDAEHHPEIMKMIELHFFKSPCTPLS
jgi:hypothetical protein